MNKKVIAFLKAEAFEMSPAYARKQEKMLEEAGLFDESADTLIEMKTALAEFRDFQSRGEREKAKAKAAGLRAPPLERNEKED